MSSSVSSFWNKVLRGDESDMGEHARGDVTQSIFALFRDGVPPGTFNAQMNIHSFLQDYKWHSHPLTTNAFYSHVKPEHAEWSIQGRPDPIQSVRIWLYLTRIAVGNETELLEQNNVMVIIGESEGSMWLYQNTADVTDVWCKCLNDNIWKGTFVECLLLPPGNADKLWRIYPVDVLAFGGMCCIRIKWAIGRLYALTKFADVFTLHGDAALCACPTTVLSHSDKEHKTIREWQSTLHGITHAVLMYNDGHALNTVRLRHDAAVRSSINAGIQPKQTLSEQKPSIRVFGPLMLDDLSCKGDAFRARYESGMDVRSMLYLLPSTRT